MNIKNKHKTVEFWRRKTSILGNFRQLLCKKSDPSEILGGTRYMPCNCKSFFVLFLSLKLWRCCKTGKYDFYMIKSEKVEKKVIEKTDSGGQTFAPIPLVLEGIFMS